jgi:hypothetical protein
MPETFCPVQNGTSIQAPHGQSEFSESFLPIFNLLLRPIGCIGVESWAEMMGAGGETCFPPSGEFQFPSTGDFPFPGDGAEEFPEGRGIPLIFPNAGLLTAIPASHILHNLQNAVRIRFQRLDVSPAYLGLINSVVRGVSHPLQSVRNALLF